MNMKTFRVIIPAYPEVNIYTYSKNASVVSIGAVMVATIASKLPGWHVEVINENDCSGCPRDERGLPDHRALQKESPANMVGFYCGLSCTVERVWEVAAFYKSQGIATLAGGWHAHYCPEETLRHGIDLVVHGDGEPVIQRVLNNFIDGKSLHLDVTGCSYLVSGQVWHHGKSIDYLPQIPDMDERLATLVNKVENLDSLPFPDFGLVRFMRFSKGMVYPINRIRGCGMACEFCSVKQCAAWASPKHLFQMVQWLVETRGASKFFLVDDRMEEDRVGTIEFFKMIAQKYGRKLQFFVQTRLGVAKEEDLLEVMRMAGVRTLFIGCESPIDEDLKEMKKGYTSKNMLEWVKILRRYFWLHLMFIFGYPKKGLGGKLSAEEMFLQFRSFIRKAKPDSIQVLKPIPLAGTALRRRLENDKRIFPLSLMSWSKYDGNSVCFIPDGMTIEELYDYPIKLMVGFYNPTKFFWMVARMFFFPIDYITRGVSTGIKMGFISQIGSWHSRWLDYWRRSCYRDTIKLVGRFLLSSWQKRHEESGVVDRLKDYCKKQ